MRNVRGKSALITGAASGIGRAISIRLAAEGVDLYLVDIDEAGLAECVRVCQGHGVTAVGRRCDVSRRSEVSAIVDRVVERWGGVDILINNAGISYYGRTHEMADDHWDRLLDVNLHSHIWLTRELLPSLLARREAHIVNVCSIFGLVGMPKVNAYCVSKFGLVGFSESLRAEYGREGLGVTAICPGFVHTNLFTSAPRATSTDEAKQPPRWLQTTADTVARATFSAIRRNRPVVVVEPFARGLFAVKRLLPGMVDFLFHLGRRRRMQRKLEQIERGSNEVPATVEMPQSAESPPAPPQRRAA